jgi:hypothetical protein
MVGDDREGLHQAKRLVGTDILRWPPFMASRRERSNLSADAVAYAGNADLERLSEFPKALYEFVLIRVFYGILTLRIASGLEFGINPKGG